LRFGVGLFQRDELGLLGLRHRQDRSGDRRRARRTPPPFVGMARRLPANIILHLLPPYSPELNPQENLWDGIREKIFKNYSLKSMDDVNAKLDETAFYIERNPTLVKSITSFPYIAKSL
jgi:transposase